MTVSLQVLTMALRRTLFFICCCVATLGSVSSEENDRLGFFHKNAHLSLLLQDRNVFDASHLRRNLQDDDPYPACFDTLRQADADNSGTLSADDYLTFLKLISGNEVEADSLQNLSAVFTMIFYTAACAPPGRDCVDEEPAVDLDEDSTGASADFLVFLCHQVLTFTFTTVTLTFEYTTRYNTAVTNEDQVSKCLETATENLLLSEVGECAMDLGEERRRRLRVGGGDDFSLGFSSFRELDEDSTESAGKQEFGAHVHYDRVMPTHAVAAATRLLQEEGFDTPQSSDEHEPPIAECAYTAEAEIVSLTDFRKFLLSSCKHILAGVNNNSSLTLCGHRLLLHVDDACFHFLPTHFLLKIQPATRRLSWKK